MWWTNPLWLLLLIGIVILFRRYAFVKEEQTVISAKPVIPAKNQRNLRSFAWLRLLAISAVILALAGTSVFFPSRRRSIAFLLDVSGSINRIELERERETALRWIRGMNPHDRVVIFAFAGQPNLIASLSSPANAAALLELADLKAPHPEKTDLQAALSVGRGAIDRIWGSRSILIFSDGRSTAGGLEQIRLRTGKIPIYPVPIGRPSRGLVTTALTLPKTLNEGEPAGLIWSVQNDQPTNVRVAIKIDGRLTTVIPLRIKKGNQRIPLLVPAQTAGVHRLELSTLDEKGRIISKADGGGILRIKGAPQVLIVHHRKISPVGRTLAIQGFRVRETGPEGVPEDSGELATFSEIILDNVPATVLNAAQQENIQYYVSSGGGLLVIGGDASLGRGAYYDTPLEEVLPVQTDTRQRLRFTRANILFIIDHSGSMSDTVGRSSKQLAAMKGIVAATKGLNPADEVGILTFSGKPSWALPFTSASKKEEIRDALNHLDSGGGTELNNALEEAVRGFSRRGPVCKHVVLLTDGITGWEGLQDLCGKLRAMGATISTIGVGDDLNEPLLRAMARWGQGKYYRAVKDQLPQIIVRETVRVTRDLIQEGTFIPKNHSDHEALIGLGNLPAIKGYILTKAKGISNILLETGKKSKDPLLAVWQYGGGQAAVFTSDSGERWLGPWLGTPVYNRFWAQLARSIERRSSDAGLHMTTAIENGWLHLAVDAVDAERRLLTGLQLVGESVNGPEGSFRLEETAPGHYEAVLPLEGNGLREFQIRDEQSGEWVVDGFWVPPSLEYRALGPDWGLLGSLSHDSGGEPLSINRLRLPSTGWSWEPVSLRFALIILALVLFLFELAIRSLALGQYGMIRSALILWRQTQTDFLQRVRGTLAGGTPVRSDEAAREGFKSQRYMAGMTKEKNRRSLND